MRTPLQVARIRSTGTVACVNKNYSQSGKGRRWTERLLALTLALALALLAGVSARKGTLKDPVTTTTPPMPITGPTTVEYSLRLAVTEAMNDVAAAGRFVPRLDDLRLAGASVRMATDENNDGYDDDGRIEMSRDGVTLCITLPSETGKRFVSIFDGECS